MTVSAFVSGWSCVQRSRLAYVAESRPGSVLSGSWRARWDGTCVRVPGKAPSEPLSLFFYVSVPNGAVELDSAVVDTRTSSKVRLLME